MEWGDEDILPAADAQKIVDALATEMQNIHDDISEFPIMRDPYLVPTENIPDLEGHFGLQNGEELGLTEEERRKRLIAYPDLVRVKGTEPSLDYWFYYYGFRLDIISMWTDDYLTFTQYPPLGDVSFYPTPHFILQVDLGETGYIIDGTFSYSPTPIPADAQDIQDVVDQVKVIKPAETVLQYVNLVRYLSDDWLFTTIDLELQTMINPNYLEDYPLPIPPWTIGQVSPTPIIGGNDPDGDPWIIGGGYPDYCHLLVTEGSTVIYDGDI